VPSKSKTAYHVLLAGITCALVLGAMAEAASAQQNPSLTLSTTSGSAGPKITVSGKFFHKSQLVSLTWDGSSSDMPTTSTGPSGSFSSSVVIPTTAALGSHTIAAMDTGGAVVSAAFQVVAAAIVVPPTSTPAATATNTPAATATSTPAATATNTPGATATNTPAAATTPVSGMLLFSADFDTGNLSQWCSGCIHVGGSWGNSSATVVGQGGQVLGRNNDGPWTAPAPRKGSYSGALLVDGPTGTTSQRAELNSNWRDYEGSDRYYGVSLYVPSNPNGSNLNNLLDFAVWQAGAGTAVNLQMQGTGFVLSTVTNQAGSSFAWDNIDSSGLVLDQWIDFTIHVVWSRTNTGSVTVWMNGAQRLSLSNIQTMSSVMSDTNGYFVYSEYDWYREPQSVPSLLYMDQIKIGTTYAVVQP
jgi:hypothetical protein